MFDARGHRKYLNRPERLAFLRSAEREVDPVKRALCLTVFHTGCRLSEALELNPDRVDTAGAALILRTLKRRDTSHFRSVPIPDSLVDELSGIIANADHGSRIWPFSRTTAWRCFKGQMKHAGISGTMACPKGLRHGFAVACLSAGIPLPIVQKWLGHARLDTTAIYLDVCGDEEREYAKQLWQHERKIKPSERWKNTGAA